MNVIKQYIILIVYFSNYTVVGQSRLTLYVGKIVRTIWIYAVLSKDSDMDDQWVNFVDMWVR